MQTETIVLGGNRHSIADGGDTTFKLKVPAGATIKSLALRPADSCPKSFCRVVLRNPDLIGKDVIYVSGIASLMDGSIALTWFGAVSVDNERAYELAATVWNYTGAAKDWILSACCEVRK